MSVPLFATMTYGGHLPLMSGVLMQPIPPAGVYTAIPWHRVMSSAYTAVGWSGSAGFAAHAIMKAGHVT